MDKVLYLAPRILSLLFVAFLSLFALDVFNEYQGFSLVLPLLIHLLPSLILLVIVAFAWKYDLVGAAAFLSFAALYVWQAGLDRPWRWYAVIAGPAALVGVLYLANWLRKRKAPDLI